MARSNAATVEEYLAELPEDRRDDISQVRQVILANLPQGYVETMNWGMISYEIPLETFPNTYNKKPLGVAGLAAQKNYNALYLTTVYGDKGEWFKSEYRKTGKRLDMGKSCVRFMKVEDLPLDLVGKVIASMAVDDLIAAYQRFRA